MPQLYTDYILYNTVTASKHRCLRFRNIIYDYVDATNTLARKDHRVRVRRIGIFFFSSSSSVFVISFILYICVCVWQRVRNSIIASTSFGLIGTNLTRARILNYSQGGFTSMFDRVRIISISLLVSLQIKNNPYDVSVFLFSSNAVAFDFRHTRPNTDRYSRKKPPTVMRPAKYIQACNQSRPREPLKLYKSRAEKPNKVQCLRGSRVQFIFCVFLKLSSSK